MAWVMENSLDEDVTNLGARLHTNTGQYVLLLVASLLAMCLSNQSNTFLGCQDISNSSPYIHTKSTPAPHATSLQALQHLFPPAFPEEMQFLTVFPATLRTSFATTWPMYRMEEHQIHMPYKWNNQLRAAAAV